MRFVHVLPTMGLRSTVDAGSSMLVGDRQQKTRGVTTGPLVAVLVALVCMAVGQATGVRTLKGTGVDPSSPTGVIVSCLAAFLPTAVLLGAWVALGERRPVASLGLSGAGRTRGILIGGASAVAGLIVLNVGASMLSGSAEGDSGDSIALGTAVLLLVAVTVQASTEELVFRGFLLPKFSERWGAAAGVLGSSALFACAHLANASAPVAYILMTFLLGDALALWALADGCIWRSCAFHTMWNFVPQLASGDAERNASADFDAATLGVAAVVLLALVAFALRAYRRSVTSTAAA